MPLAVYLGLFAVVLSFYSSRPAAAQAVPSVPVKATNTPLPNTLSVPVTVVNTPLPVTGNVNAAVTGTVNANITNTPSVSVLSLPVVQLAAGTTVGVTGGTFSLTNTSATPIFTRDVNNPTNQPFAASLCVTSGGPGTCAAHQDFRVPATIGANSAPVLELVIEYYSASCVVFGGSGLGCAY